jgi:hypothetical protein
LRTLFSDMLTSGCGALRASRLVKLNPINTVAFSHTEVRDVQDLCSATCRVSSRLRIFDIMGTDARRDFVSSGQFISTLKLIDPLGSLMLSAEPLERVRVGEPATELSA